MWDELSSKVRFIPHGEVTLSEELKPRVKELIVRQLKLDLDPASIKDDAPLFGDADGGLGLDSIDALELVLGVEKEFGIKVQDLTQAEKMCFYSGFIAIVFFSDDKVFIKHF